MTFTEKPTLSVLRPVTYIVKSGREFGFLASFILVEF